MSDVLVRIKRAVLAGHYAFSEKARVEMEADSLTELDVAESILNAVAVYKTVWTRTIFLSPRNEHCKRKFMVKVTKCPACGSKKIKKVRRDWVGEHHGQTYTVRDLEFHECPSCHERVYDREAMRKVEAQSPAYEKAHA